ncbi:MAG: helicase-related protein [Candidatus Nanohaloarchaea archaeon]
MPDLSDKPTFVDNQEGNTLANALNEYIEYLDDRLEEPPELDIATGYFNPEGFFSIAQSLDKLDKVRILIGATPENKDRRRWRKPGEPRDDRYKAEKIEDQLQKLDQDLEEDRDLLGFSEEVESNLKHMLKVLRSDKVEVRRFEEEFLHGKAYLFSNVEEGVIAGSSNFTGGGLNTNLELNLGQYDPRVTREVRDWFEDLWERSEPYDLASLYEERFEPYDPYLIYLRVLWERYKDEIRDEEEQRGDKIELTTFQNDGKFRAKKFLDEHNGVILADSVGLGKTYIAGDLIREAVDEHRQKALVIAPAYLKEGMWEKKRSEWQVQFDTISYAELRNEKQLGGEREYLNRDKEEYQLVIVDEAHAFRNPGTDQAHALRTLLRGDPPKDLVLITATPVNNSLWDLYYQLNYFVKNDAKFANEGIPSLKEKFKEAQSEDPSDLSPEMLFDVLDKTTVRRTRSFVKKNYQNEQIEVNGNTIRIKFPETNPERVDYDFEGIISDEFFEDVADGLAAGEREDPELSLARYMPSKYRKDKEIDHSEIALAGLLRTGLLKRFESSLDAFINTVEGMIDQYNASLELLENGKFPDPNAIDEWIEADSDEAFEEVFGEEEVRELGDNVDKSRLKDDLENDLEILRRWRNRAESVSLEEDCKLEKMKEKLKDIVKEAEEDASGDKEFRQNRKILIFSYFEDTVDRIIDYLETAVESEEELKWYKDRIAGITSNEAKGDASTKKEAVQGFAPESTDSPTGDDKFDILVATDVLGQGANLQDARHVMNYDLPWNPMRVVQRNGRIDRINSPHSQIFAHTFFPEDRLDELLTLENRVRKKITRAAKSVGLENEVIPDSDTVEQNFAEKREQIEKIREEEEEAFDKDKDSATYSGEEYRQELRKGLQEREDDIKSLPWAAGSGYKGENPGYFFAAKVGEDNFFTRFIPKSDGEIVSDTLTCLQNIECDEETDRSLDGESRERIYDAWKKARDDIYEDWQEQTDPRNRQPEIRPLFRQVAEHLRENPPEDISQSELERAIDSVEAPYGRRYERELRDIYEDENLGNMEKSEELLDKIEELGLQPFEPPEPLDPIDKEEIQLICWMAIEEK